MTPDEARELVDYAANTTSRSFLSRSRSGTCTMCSNSSNSRRLVKPRMAPCLRPAIRRLCR